MITYISGGVRSGKSRYAQEMALNLSKNPVYIATAKIWDEDFAARVGRHRADRGPEWTTYEVSKDLAHLPVQGRTVVIDCATLWLTSIFMDLDADIQRSLDLFKAEIDALETLEGIFIIVSNELGMGLHAESELGRKFTDLQGWANQYMASKAHNAWFMISGIPLKIK